MKEEIAKQWVEALRSGKYKQGFKALNDASGRKCCLGVLCDLSGLSEWQRCGNNNQSYFGAPSYAPRPVMGWSGLKRRSGEIPGVLNLAIKNDSGATFSEIADLIEKHWKEL